MNILGFLFRPKLDKEAYDAYWDRLPSKIAVNWFRSGKFIVGNIEVGGEKFMTQGRNADEFIMMVNETVYSVYDIPVEYYQNVKMRDYTPSSEEYNHLQNVSISNSVFSVKKVKQPCIA